MHILVTANFSEDLIDKIRSVSRELEVEQIVLPNNRWPDDQVTEAEIYYANWGIPRLDQAPNLKWVQTHVAGVDYLLEHPVWKSDVLLTSASGVHAVSIAQYVMAQMLAWSNRVPRWIKFQESGQWAKDRWKQFLPTELRGKTLGIIGYGSVGREVARLAKSFNMTILATKRDARRLEDTGYMIPGTGDRNGDLADRIYPPEATRSMVAECDFAVITAPLTSKTRHFVDEEMLRAMKSSAYLINVGRGAVVKEDDLVRALKKGWIAGAGLDVYEQEPLPENSPLWKLENVILSPHVSGFTPEYDARAVDLFTENLRRYLSGEPLLNLVNRERGY